MFSPHCTRPSMRLCDYRCQLSRDRSSDISSHALQEWAFFPSVYLQSLRKHRTPVFNIIKDNIHLVCHEGNLSISSLLWYKHNRILKSVRLRRNRSQWDAGTVIVEKTLSLCISICTKSSVINHTKQVRHKPLEVQSTPTWSEGNCSADWEAQGSWEFLEIPFQAKQALACQQGPLFFPSFAL